VLLRVLNAISDEQQHRRIEQILRQEHVSVLTLDEQPLDFRQIHQFHCDIVVIERADLPEPLTDSIGMLTGSGQTRIVIVMTGQFEPGEQARMKSAGVEALLPLNLTDEQLSDVFTSIVQHRREILKGLLTARRSLRQPELSDFVSLSGAMQELLGTVHLAVDSPYPLLIQGEVGVGKERLARAVHTASRRADGPFIAVRCSGFPDDVLENHIFGSGLSNGADRTVPGRGGFEVAHGGTLYIEDICDLTLHLQARLHDVLEDGTIRIAGSETLIPVDVRVIVSSSRDIQQEIEEGRFRHDLFFQLNVLTVTMPPLRERIEDIPPLAAALAEQIAARTGKQVRGLSPVLVDTFRRYHWPGNTSEMISILERAILISDGDVIDVQDLPLDLAMLTDGMVEPVSGPEGHEVTVQIPENLYTRSIKDVRAQAVRQVEKVYLTRLLEETKGRIGETAERAGIEPRSLYGKMKSYGLRKEDFKP